MFDTLLSVIFDVFFVNFEHIECTIQHIGLVVFS